MKNLLIILLSLMTVSVRAEILTFDLKYPENNELYMDKKGTIRYKFYPSDALEKWHCDGAYTKDVRQKCLQAREVLEQKVRMEDKNKNADKPYTGKLRFDDGSGLSPIFYIKNGVQAEPLNMIHSNYYVETDMRGTEYIYDVDTEQPFNGEFFLGKLHVPTKGGITTEDSWVFLSQPYRDGLPDGKPIAVVKTKAELQKEQE